LYRKRWNLRTSTFSRTWTLPRLHAIAFGASGGPPDRRCRAEAGHRLQRLAIQNPDAVVRASIM
jgi:hypothetical protein